MKSILLVCILTVCAALNKNEIEQIRRELNGELTKLENDNQIKKSIIETKETKEVNIDEILQHFTKNRDSNDEKVKKIANNDIQAKRVSDKEASEALFDMLMNDQANKPEKRASNKAKQLWELMTKKKNENKNSEFSKKFQSALNQQLTKKSTDENSVLSKLLTDAAPLDKKSSDTEESVLGFLLHDDNAKRSLEKTKDKKRCEDTRKDCRTFKGYCKSLEYKERMSELCPLTCGTCKVCKKDTLGKTCALAKKSGYCNNPTWKAKMEEYCFETCGYCRVAAPPACQNDPEGCCWHDGVSFAKNGCHVCEDASNVARLCRNLIAECGNEYSPGKWMRRNCPVTCKYCDPVKECHDFKSYRKECKIWKEEGKCHDNYVQEICPRTCDKCKERSLENNNWK